VRHDARAAFAGFIQSALKTIGGTSGWAACLSAPHASNWPVFGNFVGRV
jgi:hypothetical protein